MRRRVLSASGFGSVPDPLPVQRPVDRGGRGEVAGLDGGPAAGVDVDVLGAVLPDGAAVLPRLLGLDDVLAGRAPGEWAEDGVDVRCPVAALPAHDVEPVAGLRCGVAVRLGVHRVERDDPEVVAEVAQALLPQRPRVGVLRVGGDIDDVLDDHRGVPVVLGEAEDVEHEEAGALHDRGLGVLVDQVGVEEVEEVGLNGHRRVLAAGGLRPLRALGGGPEDVGAGEVAGVFLVEVDRGVVGAGVVLVVDVDGELPVVGGHADLDARDLDRAGRGSAASAEEVGDGQHGPACWKSRWVRARRSQSRSWVSGRSHPGSV